MILTLWAVIQRLRVNGMPLSFWVIAGTAVGTVSDCKKHHPSGALSLSSCTLVMTQD